MQHELSRKAIRNPRTGIESRLQPGWMLGSRWMRSASFLFTLFCLLATVIPGRIHAQQTQAQSQAQQQAMALVRASGDTRARHALVIGNAEYSGLPKLGNPVNDAQDMSQALTNLGFEVDFIRDADLAAMDDAVIKFGNRLAAGQGSIGFFYYAGHGVQSGGINYLIPTDARIGAESYLKTRALAVQSVLDILQTSRNGLNIVVLDACRDNPFSWARSGSRGLSVVGQQPSGSIIVYATGAGSVAMDGGGRNGVFTAELLKHLNVPGMEINEVFRRAGRGVNEATNGRQVPAVYSQFFESAYLAGIPAEPPRAQGQASGQAPATGILQVSGPLPAGSGGATGASGASGASGSAESGQPEASVAGVPAVKDFAALAREFRATVERLKTEGSAVTRNEETLRGYLVQLAMLETKLAAMGTAFGELAASETSRIDAEFLVKKTEAERIELEPWETDKEYADRKASLLSEVAAAKSAALATMSAALAAERAAAEKDLRAAIARTGSELQTKTWTLKGAQVRLESLPFEREAKVWPLRVMSVDPALSFTGQIGYSMKDATDMARTYRGFESSLKAGKIDAEIVFGYERVPDKDLVLAVVRSLRLVDRGANNKVLAVSTQRQVAHASKASEPDRKLGNPTLRIESDPEGAAVSSGDKKLGVTPLVVTAQVGSASYTLTWTGEGEGEAAVTATREVALDYGEDKTLTLKRPSYGDMVLVEGGSFRMGSDSNYADEKPAHEVVLSSFLMGRYEVTQSEYLRVTGKNPSAFAKGLDAGMHPVDQVSWLEAVTFCNARSDLEGLSRVYTIAGSSVTADMTQSGYRLPTEAEWEYAARGGKLSKGYAYAGSGDLAQVAWHDANSGKTTRPVGTKAANELGLFDMSGNVWEWCQDWYDPAYYGKSSRTDPLGAASGSNRVNRGGSWDISAEYCRVAFRSSSGPGGRGNSMGFRLVRRP